MSIQVKQEDSLPSSSKIYPFPSGSQDPTQNSSQDVSQTSRAQAFALMLEMLSVMNNLSAELIQLYGKQQEIDEKTAQANQLASQANYQNVKQQTDSEIKQIQEQQDESTWQKFLGDVLPVLTIVIAFAFFGPGAALVVGLMTAVSMSLDPSSPIGFAGKALAGVLGDKGEFYFSLGMTVAMTLAGAGAASFMSKFDTIAEAAEEVGSQVANNAGKAAEDAAVNAAEDQAGNIGNAAEDQAANVGNAAEDQAGNAANAPKSEPTPEQKLAKFQSARTAFLTTTGFSTAFSTFDPFMAGINAYGSDDLKKAEWVQYLDLALKLVVAIVSMLALPGEGADSSIVGWKGASNLYVSKGLTWAQKFLNLGSAGVGVASGITSQNIGDIQNTLSIAKGISEVLTVTQQLVDENMKMASQAIANIQKEVQMVQQSSVRWSADIQAVAQALQA